MQELYKTQYITTQEWHSILKGIEQLNLIQVESNLMGVYARWNQENKDKDQVGIKIRADLKGFTDRIIAAYGRSNKSHGVWYKIVQKVLDLYNGVRPMNVVDDSEEFGNLLFKASDVN